uniref:Uncharacterized protein n=1 Tax=Timema monikensis TaxID=170555 RepID=A0A7R9EA89_9NEOP|nr:unnamed protein product [Timema monikensis]
MISLNGNYSAMPEEGIILNALAMVLVALGILLSYAVRRDSFRTEVKTFVSERLSSLSAFDTIFAISSSFESYQIIISGCNAVMHLPVPYHCPSFLITQGPKAQNSKSPDPKAQTPPRCQCHPSSVNKPTAPQSPTHFLAATTSKLVTWAITPAVCTTYNENSLMEEYQSTGTPRAPVGNRYKHRPLDLSSASLKPIWWDGRREGERHGLASQPTKEAFHTNKNRWIMDTVDGASYRTGLTEKSHDWKYQFSRERLSEWLLAFPPPSTPFHTRFPFYPFGSDMLVIIPDMLVLVPNMLVIVPDMIGVLEFIYWRAVQGAGRSSFGIASDHLLWPAA